MSTRLVLIGVLFIQLVLAACHSYTVVQPAQVVDYKRVRVTTATGERVNLYGPTVEGDSIVGSTEAQPPSAYYHPPMTGYALADVRLIEGVRGQPVKSAGVFLLSIAGVLAAVVVIFLATCDNCMGS